MTDIDSGKRNHGILKRDVRGRVRTGTGQREALLDEFERSGLSGPKFSQLAGVCYQTFAGWMRKRRLGNAGCAPSPVPHGAARTASTPALVRWVEADTGLPDAAGAVPESKPEGGTPVPVTVRLAGGVTVEVSEERQLSLVVELVRQLSVHTAKPC